MTDNIILASFGIGFFALLSGFIWMYTTLSGDISKASSTANTALATAVSANTAAMDITTDRT